MVKGEAAMDKIDAALLAEYSAMAKEDGFPISLILVNGQWLALEYLDDERDIPPYYFVHPSGYIGYGPHAAEEAMDKGLRGSQKPLRAQTSRRGKYGRVRVL